MNSCRAALSAKHAYAAAPAFRPAPQQRALVARRPVLTVAEGERAKRSCPTRHPPAMALPEAWPSPPDTRPSFVLVSICCLRGRSRCDAGSGPRRRRRSSTCFLACLTPPSLLLLPLVQPPRHASWCRGATSRPRPPSRPTARTRWPTPSSTLTASRRYAHGGWCNQELGWSWSWSREGCACCYMAAACGVAAEPAAWLPAQPTCCVT